jgi:CheY-like chemotaxis protein
MSDFFWSNRPKRSILVVDDDEGMREVLREILEGQGYRVVAAENGVDALNTVDSSICLIIMDIFMPALDGLATLRKFREDPATADVPVLLISGCAGEVAREAARVFGALDFLQKPVSVATVRQKVDSILKCAV